MMNLGILNAFLHLKLEKSYNLSDLIEESAISLRYYIKFYKTLFTSDLLYFSEMKLNKCNGEIHTSCVSLIGE